MSIRLRLALLYTLILVLTLLIAGILLFVNVSRINTNMLKDELLSDAEQIVNYKDFELDKLQYRAKYLYAPQIYAQTTSLDGTVIDQTDNLGDNALPVSGAGMAALQGGDSWIETVPVDGGRLMVYSRVIEDYTGQVGVIQVGRSLADYDQSLNALQNILIIGGSVITLLAFGIGWLLAGTALRPINSIIKTAQTIGRERDFDRRIHHTGPADEIGTLATTINIMLEELRAAYQQIGQTLQAQRRFVADASHELRTPLTTIRGNVELLRRNPPIDERDRVAVLNDMVDEAERMMRLVNDLLTLARTDAGAYRSHLMPLTVAPLLEEVQRQVRLLDPQRTIEIEAAPNLAVIGDRDALKQVLLILLDNALKYSTGPVSLRAQTVIGQGSGQATEQGMIQVVDAGPGIDPGLLPNIFERFYRGDVARTGTGTGLGLAIAKVLMELQQGTIAVASQPGRGSTFTVTLPLTRAEPDAAFPTLAPQPLISPSTGD